MSIVQVVCFNTSNRDKKKADHDKILILIKSIKAQDGSHKTSLERD